MVPRSGGHGRRSPSVAAAGFLLLLAPACTDGGDGDARAASSTSHPRHEWCDVLETLELPEDAPAIELTDVPIELVITIQFLADAQILRDEDTEDPYPPDLDLAAAVAERAKVDAWSQAHCGTEDPFCSLWTSFNALVAADPTRVPVQFAVRTIDDELLQYAPDEHFEAVQDYLVPLFASYGTPAPSDYSKGDAEAAFAELDGWVGEHCPTDG